MIISLGMMDDASIWTEKQHSTSIQCMRTTYIVCITNIVHVDNQEIIVTYIVYYHIRSFTIRFPSVHVTKKYMYVFKF